MTTLAIAISIAFAFAVGLFTGAASAAGSRADQDQQISRLRWHLRKILSEAHTGRIDPQTFQNARKTLYDDNQ